VEPGPLESCRYGCSCSVGDTGISIAADSRAHFQTGKPHWHHESYGGTGLGLSISQRNRATPGWQKFLSRVGQGSTFTLYLHKEDGKQRSREAREVSHAVRLGVPFGDKCRGEQRSRPLLAGLAQTPSHFLSDHNEIQPGDRVLLIMEDDINFARIC